MYVCGLRVLWVIGHARRDLLAARVAIHEAVGRRACRHESDEATVIRKPINNQHAALEGKCTALIDARSGVEFAPSDAAIDGEIGPLIGAPEVASVHLRSTLCPRVCVCVSVSAHPRELPTVPTPIMRPMAS